MSNPSPLPDPIGEIQAAPKCLTCGVPCRPVNESDGGIGLWRCRTRSCDNYPLAFMRREDPDDCITRLAATVERLEAERDELRAKASQLMVAHAALTTSDTGGAIAALEAERDAAITGEKIARAHAEGSDAEIEASQQTLTLVMQSNLRLSADNARLREAADGAMQEDRDHLLAENARLTEALAGWKSIAEVDPELGSTPLYYQTVATLAARTGGAET